MSGIDKKRLALFLLLALLLPGALGEDLLSGDALKPEEVNYRTETVRRGVYEKTVSGTASVVYPITCQVTYEYSQARFLEYAVSRGDAVRAGDVLARFRMTGSEAEMARLELSLTRGQEAMERELSARDEAIAAATAALETCDPAQREKQALLLRWLEVERAQYANRQNYQLELQRQAVAAARAALTADVLRAPVDGVVADLTPKKQDEAILAGEPLVTLQCDTDVMLLRLDNRAGSFRYNMPVTVTAGGRFDGVTLSGRVVASDDVVPEGRRMGAAYVRLDPYAGDIPLGNLQVSAAGIRVEDVALVSRRAVTQEEGKDCVIKLTDGMSQKRFVNVGHANTTDMWILQGVCEGETLILN